MKESNVQSRVCNELKIRKEKNQNPTITKVFVVWLNWCAGGVGASGLFHLNVFLPMKNKNEITGGGEEILSYSYVCILKSLFLSPETFMQIRIILCNILGPFCFYTVEILG